MSSGEKGKSPASFEERNPFDISKRSGTDVAAEIAQRLVAWKQARARSYAAATTVPVSEKQLPAGKRAETKAPPIAAPVQPPRLPQSLGETATARSAFAAGASGTSTVRAPFFASFSTVKRAMPSAPSLKDPGVKAATSGATVIETAAAETPAFDAPADEPLGANATAPEIDAREPARTFDAPAAEPRRDDVAPPASAIADVPNEQDSIHAYEADALRADEPRARAQEADSSVLSPTDALKSIHAREAEEDLTAEAPAAETQASEYVAPATSTVEAPEAGARESLDASGVNSTELVESGEAEAHDTDVPPADAAPEMPEIESPSVEIRASDDWDADTGRVATPAVEAFGVTAPVVPAIGTQDIERDRLAAREIKAKWMRAHELDELAIEMAAAKERQTKPIAAVAPALEEPAIHEPAVASPRVEAPLSAEPTGELLEIEEATSAVAVFPEADEFARIEPTFDRPMTNAPELAAAPEAVLTPDAASAAALRGIVLPSIETRIERRRFSALRAEPQPAVRHPLFPDIETEAWDVPPAVAARASRAPRAGTGWAIGLGAILLVIGVTAPAAIWQGQRSAQTDQVVLLTPAPIPPANATSQATLPDPPQPAVAPTSSVQATTDQARLRAVQDGGEVAATPIFKPPFPQLETASEPATQVDPGSADGSVLFPPVARPFVPEGQAAAFMTASNGPQTSSVVVRPSLMARLKPKAPAGMLTAPVAKSPAPAARKVTQKPNNPQSLDQMFRTLIDTLSDGQPVNPANKPVPPSTRR